LTLVVRDMANNQSVAEQLVVPKPPLKLVITSPATGVYLDADSVIVRGSHNGPDGTGIVVNGIRAIVQTDGTFIAPGVALHSGENIISATAATFEGEIVEATTAVDSSGAQSGARLIVSELEGVAPFKAKFRV